MSYITTLNEVYRRAKNEEFGCEYNDSIHGVSFTVRTVKQGDCRCIGIQISERRPFIIADVDCGVESLPRFRTNVFRACRREWYLS